MKVKEIFDIIQNDGWYLVRTRGSHRQFHHATKAGTVTVAGKPSDDVLRGIENSILKQASLKKRGEKMQYTVNFETNGKTWGAYIPDLPGCVAVGDTREEVSELIHEAIEMHLEDMRATGQEIPQPTTWSELVEVA